MLASAEWQSGVSLPPGVRSRIRRDVRGEVRLVVDRVAWSISPHPTSAQVRVRWWGERGVGCLLRPSVREEDVAPPSATTRVRFPVCSGLNQLRAYFRDMGTLSLDVADPLTHRILGRATMEMAGIDVDCPLRRMVDIRSNEDDLLGKLAVGLDIHFPSPHKDYRPGTPAGDSLVSFQMHEVETGHPHEENRPLPSESGMGQELTRTSNNGHGNGLPDKGPPQDAAHSIPLSPDKAVVSGLHEAIDPVTELLLRAQRLQDEMTLAVSQSDVVIDRDLPHADADGIDDAVALKEPPDDAKFLWQRYQEYEDDRNEENLADSCPPRKEIPVQDDTVKAPSCDVDGALRHPVPPALSLDQPRSIVPLAVRREGLLSIRSAQLLVGPLNLVLKSVSLSRRLMRFALDCTFPVVAKGTFASDTQASFHVMTFSHEGPRVPLNHLAVLGLRIDKEMIDEWVRGEVTLRLSVETVSKQRRQTFGARRGTSGSFVAVGRVPILSVFEAPNFRLTTHVDLVRSDTMVLKGLGTSREETLGSAKRRKGRDEEHPSSIVGSLGLTIELLKSGVDHNIAACGHELQLYLRIDHASLTATTPTASVGRGIRASPHGFHVIVRTPLASAPSRTRTCWARTKPCFAFRYVHPLNLTALGLENFQRSHIVLEVWDQESPSVEETLVGITTLPLESLGLLLGTSDAPGASLSGDYPLFSVNGYVPIRSPLSGATCGKINVALAVGTATQVHTYQLHERAAICLQRFARGYLTRCHLAGFLKGTKMPPRNDMETVRTVPALPPPLEAQDAASPVHEVAVEPEFSTNATLLVAVNMASGLETAARASQVQDLNPYLVYSLFAGSKAYEGTWIPQSSQVVHHSVNPTFDFKDTVDVNVDAVFLSHVRRGHATFEVWHRREGAAPDDWSRDVLLGTAHVPLLPLLSGRKEVRGHVPLYADHMQESSHKPVGMLSLSITLVRGDLLEAERSGAATSIDPELVPLFQTSGEHRHKCRVSVSAHEEAQHNTIADCVSVSFELEPNVAYAELSREFQGRLSMNFHHSASVEVNPDFLSFLREGRVCVQLWKKGKDCADELVGKGFVTMDPFLTSRTRSTKRNMRWLDNVVAFSTRAPRPCPASMRMKVTLEFGEHPAEDTKKNTEKLAQAFTKCSVPPPEEPELRAAVTICVERAAHLPMVSRSLGTGQVVAPSVLVSFDWPGAGEIVSQTSQASVSPCWDFVRVLDVFNVKQFWEDFGKRSLCFSVWDVGSDGERRRLLGTSAVDLTVLRFGLRELDTWHHIVDARERRQGQLKVRIAMVDQMVSPPRPLVTRSDVSSHPGGRDLKESMDALAKMHDVILGRLTNTTPPPPPPPMRDDNTFPNPASSLPRPRTAPMSTNHDQGADGVPERPRTVESLYVLTRAGTLTGSRDPSAYQQLGRRVLDSETQRVARILYTRSSEADG